MKTTTTTTNTGLVAIWAKALKGLPRNHAASHLALEMLQDIARKDDNGSKPEFAAAAPILARILIIDCHVKFKKGGKK